MGYAYDRCQQRRSANVPICLPRPLLLAVLPLTLLLIAAGQAAAANDSYRIDPVHTRVLFAVSHAGFSQALGTVSGSEGTLQFDPDDWTQARVDVRIPLARLDLGDSKWNEATRARNLLDTDDHPEARFVSTVVEPVDGQHARVHGDLTVRGVTRPATLEVSLNALKRHPLPPFRRTAGFSATTTLSRAAFGVSGWPSMIGDAVQIRIEIEAVRDRSATDAGTDADAAPPSAPLPTSPAGSPT